MTLGDRERRLQARHASLVEIGERGVERLAALSVRFASGAAAPAIEVARAYLVRAGATVSDEADADAARVVVPSREDVARLAGRPSLEPAAAALAGAFAAVEAIKSGVGAGVPAELPALVLGDDA